MGSKFTMQRGTLAMLKDWLEFKFKTREAAPLEEIMATFRKVRKLRQRPAHKLTENKHDESLFETSASCSLRPTSRFGRSAGPRITQARSVADDMDQLVRSGNIWDF